jgi:acetylornithine deacetylase/succinyl-diaminopimelate desuccinylase-like protein
MDRTAALTSIERAWDGDVLPALDQYIRIPNVSPLFDPGWAEAGHMRRAVELLADWARSRPIDGAVVEVHEVEGRTPVLLVDVPPRGGAGDDTVLLYGHLDKQPAMTGWRDGLDPWVPVREGDRLYGRGGADDGYSMFAALTAIEAVQETGGRHVRCIVLIEASEESGSPDLPAHIERLGRRMGEPSLVIGLDSFCASYERLWLTTSLRGLVGLDMTVDVLREGVHSGMAGGVVPSAFRILRSLLSRIEDEGTGEVLVPALHVDIPAGRDDEMVAAAAELGDVAGGTWPFVEGAGKQHAGDPAAQLRSRTWKPSVAVVGLDGVPAVASAGNVLLPSVRAKVSVRLPPTCDADAAAGALVAVLSADPPHGARVTVDVADIGPGWHAPPPATWLTEAVEAASELAFGQPARAMGEGGTIPFMGMLGARFPDAQFVITGVLGPGSNAHGPNEFLHVPAAQRVSAAVASILDAHARR